MRVEDKSEVESLPDKIERPDFRLPRDVAGSDLIDTIRRMNRAFLQAKGITGQELDKQSDPHIRQKGSHATIYCAETGRIAPVPMHSMALPIKTFRNILRILKLDPARFVRALG